MLKFPLNLLTFLSIFKIISKFYTIFYYILDIQNFESCLAKLISQILWALAAYSYLVLLNFYTCIC